MKNVIDLRSGGKMALLRAMLALKKIGAEKFFVVERTSHEKFEAIQICLLDDEGQILCGAEVLSAEYGLKDLPLREVEA